jgi:pimeloyl-ACP methyl ester carboxylesterase
MTPATPIHEGAGEPLVLLHGFSDTWRAWTPVVALLRDSHEVFAWSLPGHSDGEPWDRSVAFSISSYADAVEAQLDARGLDRVHLAGNSLGGWLALELAGRGRALSVVGVCPAGGWEAHSADERRLARYFRRNRLLLKYFGRALPFVARHTSLRRLALRDVVTDGRKIPAASALALFEGAKACEVFDEVLGLIDTDARFAPQPIACPVRILYSSNDRLLRWPSCYGTMRRQLADAEWVCLDGLGHVPMWDSPEVVAAAILEHTQQSSGQSDTGTTLSA